MPVPLHLQIQADIMGAIERGDFPVGEQLPSETELQARYGVSRATIRKVLQQAGLKESANAATSTRGQ